MSRLRPSTVAVGQYRIDLLCPEGSADLRQDSSVMHAACLVWPVATKLTLWQALCSRHLCEIYEIFVVVHDIQDGDY